MVNRLSAERLRAVISYDPATGKFTWLQRAEAEFAKPSLAMVWNLRFCGKEASAGHPKGYRQISIDRTIHLAHRLAWLYVHGSWPNKIDHINGDKTDNRLANLRSVTTVANQRNQKLKRTNTSGVTGVQWHDECGKWLARITVDYRTLYLGLFHRKAEAIAARRAAEKQYGFHKNHGRVRSQER